MNIHVGTNLWPETIMHARCKLFFEARGVRPEQRPHCLHRPACKGRWPWVVGMLDPRTDAPCSRSPAFGPVPPYHAPPLLHKNNNEDGPAPCKDDTATSQPGESSSGELQEARNMLHESQPGAPSLEIEEIFNSSSKEASDHGFDEVNALQTSKMSVSLSPLAMQSWRDGR